MPKPKSVDEWHPQTLSDRRTASESISQGGKLLRSLLVNHFELRSLKKGARFWLTDPETGENVEIFHPSQDNWDDHFRWEGSFVEGLTGTGKITIKALDLNRPLMVGIQDEEAHWGHFPPS